ncbi:MAG: tRNA (adenosine(37)-N6)-threonylcarbamoyltransferase complex dimerization subunit type 1 TsaB [Burkholderiales bacterium]|jgi:tRNA threonylcarbamoyladenosine biosynthesis protein TsaB|nr:tRNA (adenosine(37)-N6)-threonylcarbamoyltransferase complex dimerization subunit type 1 TsaB [Burkholderiales bacterium]
MTSLLAFDTATERMSIALAHGGKTWTREAAGGAQASATLLPAILALLEEASITLAALAAIAFGRGPGAFTGLRTACSVAQGLAYGANKPVLPIDTLLAVAEDARQGSDPQDVWVVMDARMNEIYAARYGYADGQWMTLVPAFLANVEQVNERWQALAPQVIAGSALAIFPDLRTGDARLAPDAAPRAQAMLPLAQALWNDGGEVDAALAIPLYVRDKVAQTTAEREALRIAREQAALEAAR